MGNWKKIDNNKAEYEKTYTYTQKKTVTLEELLRKIEDIERDIARLQEKKAEIQADIDEINALKKE